MLYYSLKDVKKSLKRLYYNLKSIRIPSIEATSFYIKVNNSLLIPLSSMAKQLSASTSRVDKFNKKLLNPFLVLDKTIMPL